ncbi:MAG: uroporphyrinogen-III synthase [Magnetococcales bacterium]|nr:uroporphyrinogen-III synthase [Magnetococcales bacterium]
MTPPAPAIPAPLVGRTLLITRPQPEAAATAALVTRRGGVALLAPALEIRPPRDPAPLAAALAALERYQGVVITSANGARAFLAALPAAGPRPPVFAVGPKTARVLEKHGYPTLQPTRPGHAADLGRDILARLPRGSRLLCLRAEVGRWEAIALLEQEGCPVDLVTAYRAEPVAALPPAVVREIETGRVDAVLFFSGRSAAAFLAALPPPARAALAGATIAALSPITAGELRTLGLTVHLVAERPTAEALLEAVAAYWSRTDPS